MNRLSNLRSGDVSQWSVKLKFSESAGTPGVNYTLWNAFVIKMLNLFTVVEVLRDVRLS